ncbi:S-methyl-5'-thioadenosine phosphorylase [Neobacillus notoginsengisoli]|uniref:S-methyl-5'-thioadenosine phosphorylase n=1 Tax=Neobacillus notoginsengisoli TaxID=1578198 RepID=A0A417YTQ0_9BACI|nr:MTAP family purine nucleoside phosphorylase [Neobacillus notoginsengisoli]RHW40393.1 S-methyl-5'-thioadenosine phosphorylase [Neobacillus notoginsengisoli]
MKIGVIGGTGFQDLFEDVIERKVETEFGEVTAFLGTCMEKEIVFIPRHGKGHSTLAPYVNYKGNIQALKKLEVDRIISVSAVGSINPAIKVGSLGYLDNFFDMTKRSNTYGKYSVDMTDPFCPEINEVFSEAAKKINEPINENLQLVCVEGPRYETRLEISLFGKWGIDVVGMTTATEAALARELGMCYSVTTLTTNMAAGVTNVRPSLKVHKEVGERKNATMKKLVIEAINLLTKRQGCTCPEPYERIREAMAVQSH